MKKYLFVYLLIFWVSQTTYGQKLHYPASSLTPNKAQKQQIARKYGMFIHFGINTFHDENGRMDQRLLLHTLPQELMRNNG